MGESIGGKLPVRNTILRAMSDTESMDGDAPFSPALDVSALPKVVKDRVKALKKLQHGVLKAEAEYYKEVHQLDLKYQRVYDSINEQRQKVIAGQHEPAGDDIDWPSDEEEEDEEKITNGVGDINIAGYDENTKGIPKFWMHVLRNANEDCMMGLIEPHDEPALEYLTDITVKLNEPQNSGFTLTFHFAPDNPHFSNTTLTKQYFLREGPDEEAPLEYDGPEIISCKGCTIDWKEGMDVTKKTIKIKKIKDKKSKGSPEKDACEEIVADSFFTFFSPPKINDEGTSEVSEEDRALLSVDFDVGFSIKEKIIPRAILYFTGDILEDDDQFEDCSDDDEEDDD